MISLANQDDVIRMTDLAADYFRRVGGDGTFSPKEFVSSWDLYMNSGAGFIYKRHSGMEIKEAIGVMIWHDPFDGSRVAGTIFWFAPNVAVGLAPGILFVEVEARLKKLGIKRFYPQHPVGNVDAATFLNKHGYRVRETSYSKDI